MRWLVAIVYLVLAATTAAAAVIATPGDGAGAEVLAAAGDFELSNSNADAPVFTASEIGPGDSASGTVEIGGGGSAAAELTLSQHDLRDTPGTGGGLLSRQLTLRVRDVTAAPTTLYSGPLATMPPQPLGRLEPGASRSFEFVATLPEAGPGADQNELQGASTSVAYSWTASAAGEEPPDELELAVTRVRHRVRGPRLLVWARCDHPCAIAVRGKLRARDEDDQRRVRLRSRRAAFKAGPQLLRIKLPRGLRKWLREDPSRERMRARATFLAWDAAGDRDRVKRSLRLRSAR